MVFSIKTSSLRHIFSQEFKLKILTSEKSERPVASPAELFFNLYSQSHIGRFSFRGNLKFYLPTRSRQCVKEKMGWKNSY